MSPRISLHQAAVAAVLAGVAALPAVTKAQTPPVQPVHVVLIETPESGWVDLAALEQFTQVAATGPFLALAASYGVGPGTFDGTVSGPAFDFEPGATVTHDSASHVTINLTPPGLRQAVDAYVDGLVASGSVPPNAPGRIYAVVLPGIIPSFEKGWHDTSPAGNTVAWVAYTGNPVTSLQDAEFALSHELVEAAVNPHDSNAVPEVADQCAPLADDVPAGRFALFNANGVCQTGYEQTTGTPHAGGITVRY